MPGKVNPILVEAMTMVCTPVMWHDVTIARHAPDTWLSRYESALAVEGIGAAQFDDRVDPRKLPGPG